MIVPSYPKRVLVSCIGNGDRSPAAAAVLGLFLKSAGYTDVVCESAGTHAVASRGGKAAEWAVTAMKRIGLDLSEHKRRQAGQVDLKSYDLIVCAENEVAATLIEQHGVDASKVYTVPIPNPYPCRFQSDYDVQTMPALLAAMYLVMTHYFPTK